MPTSTIVLIVEDEVLIQDLLEGALLEAGYAVRILSSGAEAMSFLDGCAAVPDALLTDINLGSAPGGWEIGRRVRDLSPMIPVIYMSGDSNHEWGSQGVANSLMIAKPFVVAQVVAAVSSLLPAAEA